MSCKESIRKLLADWIMDSDACLRHLLAKLLSLVTLHKTTEWLLLPGIDLYFLPKEAECAFCSKTPIFQSAVRALNACRGIKISFASFPKKSSRNTLFDLFKFVVFNSFSDMKNHWLIRDYESPDTISQHLQSILHRGLK